MGEAKDWLEAIDLVTRLEPDVALLSVGLPGMDCIQALRQITLRSPKTRPLMCCTNDEALIYEGLKGGAKGYLPPDSCDADFVNAVQAVYQGRLWVELRILTRFRERDDFNRSGGKGRNGVTQWILTPREKDILCALVAGATNKNIAQALYISERTVKAHLTSIFRKLHVASRSQAIVYAINSGLKSTLGCADPLPQA